MNTRYRTRSRSSSVKTEDEEQTVELEVATAALTMTSSGGEQGEISVKIETTAAAAELQPIKLPAVVEAAADEDGHMNLDTDDSWLEDVKGLVYLDDHDGYIDPEAVKIELPKCTIDDTVTSVYQCIKCGNKQPAAPDGNIHRMKCARCYNKAFNKVRPTKWVKFSAK